MSERRFKGRDWGEIEVGDGLDEVVLPIKYEMIAGHIAGTRDWFPGHHNPDYAKAQGQETIYGNTMFFQGFLERVALDWAGPAWYVSNRTLRINGSVYPGDTLVGYGKVEARGQDGDERFTADLTVNGRTRSDQPAIAATIQIAMTRESRDWWAKNR